MSDCKRHDPKAIGTGRWICDQCQRDLGPSGRPPTLAYDEVLGEIDLHGNLLLTDDGARMFFDLLRERLTKSLLKEVVAKAKEQDS
jgi:hypothetical protein